MPLMHYIRMIRPHNLFTAIADAWAGFFVAFIAIVGPQVTAEDFQTMLMLIFASGCVYSAGMVFNDVFDIERDRELHPDRPLPSGKADRRKAAIFGVALQVAGLIAAATVGLVSAGVLVVVVGLTFAYNAWLKRFRVIGGLVMGSCRSGNMLLGMSPFLVLLLARGHLAELCLPGFLGLYVCVITLISTLEESPRPRVPLAALLVLEMAVLVGLAVFLGVKFGPVDDTGGPLGSKVPFVLAALALWIGVTAAPALREPSPRNIGRIIRVSLTGIIIFDAAMLLGLGTPTAKTAATGLALLMFPMYIIGRRLSRRKTKG